MDTKVFKFSILRISDMNNLCDKLTDSQKLKAIEYYTNKESLYYVDVTYIKNRYVVVGNLEYFYAMKHLKKYNINVAINVSELDMITLSLINRLKNENLNPMVAALLFNEVSQVSKQNQVSISKLINKTQGAISNKNRLLKLPLDVQAAIINGDIKERHGRAILQLLKDPEYLSKAKIVLAATIKKNLKVDETVDLVHSLLGLEVKKRENLNMSKISETNKLKHPEVQPIIKQITSEMQRVQDELQVRFPKLEFELDEGINRGDYVFLLKMKGVNE